MKEKGGENKNMSRIDCSLFFIVQTRRKRLRKERRKEGENKSKKKE